MAHSSRHGPRPAGPLAGVLRPFPWCSPPGIGFRARPRQLSKQVPPCRSRISAAVFDPTPTLIVHRGRWCINHNGLLRIGRGVQFQSAENPG